MWNSTTVSIQAGSTSSTKDPNEQKFQHQEDEEEEEEELLQESGGQYQGEYYGEFFFIRVLLCLLPSFSVFDIIRLKLVKDSIFAINYMLALHIRVECIS